MHEPDAETNTNCEYSMRGPTFNPNASIDTIGFIGLKHAITPVMKARGASLAVAQSALSSLLSLESSHPG